MAKGPSVATWAAPKICWPPKRLPPVLSNEQKVILMHAAAGKPARIGLRVELDSASKPTP